MSENNIVTDADTKKCRNYNNGAAGGAVYGLGFIGAAIYFISHAATFWLGVLGFLKAIVWPVFAVYWLLDFLKL
jgi:hypothetical protein